jgi:hypothetical protein
VREAMILAIEAFFAAMKKLVSRFEENTKKSPDYERTS